jgi:hypothetical protein
VIWLLVAVSALALVPLRLVARTPLQSERPAAAASAVVGVVAEQVPSSSPTQESAPTKPAAPSVSTEAFLPQATEDARKAEADYRKAVEAEHRRPAEQEQWNGYVRDTQDSLRALAEETGGFAVVNMNDFDHLKREYEARAKEYESALVNFTGNQEPTEADQKAAALAQQESVIEQLRRRLEEMQQAIQAAVRAREAQQAGQSQENAQALEKMRRELFEGLTRQLAELDSSQARVQLETLARAQQTLVEQLKNLVAQQDQLATMQRQLSDQVEIIRRELERATRALAATPAK